LVTQPPKERVEPGKEIHAMIDMGNEICYNLLILASKETPMRRIRLAAIQPDIPPPAPCFDCLQPGFDERVDAVIEGHVLPRLETTLDLLSQCADAGADLAVTSEDVTGLSGFLPGGSGFFAALTARAESIARDRLSTLASRRAVRIAGCFGIHENGLNYNATIFFGKNGVIEGIYRKTHLPPNELWQFVPGASLDVFTMDIGRVAATICYDMMFAEALGVLARRGAEIILHPTGGMGWYDDIGLATLRVRANDAGAYLVTSKNYVHNAAGHSSIIDPWGLVRADAGYGRNAIAVCEVDLDQPKAQPDWFWQTRMTGVADLRARMAAERRPDLYAPLTEPIRALPIADEAQRNILRGEIRRGTCRW
jgi:N-carbamoylputrescine amidase